MLIPSVRKSWHDTPAIYTRLCLHVCSMHVCTCTCVRCCRWWHPIVFLTSDRITTVTVHTLFSHLSSPSFGWLAGFYVSMFSFCLRLLVAHNAARIPHIHVHLMNKHSFIVWVKQQERAAKIGTLCSAQGYHFMTVIPQCELDCTILCTEGWETFWWSLGDKIVSDLLPQTTFHSKKTHRLHIKIRWTCSKTYPSWFMVYLKLHGAIIYKTNMCFT